MDSTNADGRPPRRPYQNAIWHGFVLAAAGCHYGAVLDCMVLSRA
jgi:hemolysin III